MTDVIVDDYVFKQELTVVIDRSTAFRPGRPFVRHSPSFY
jgi:hypothetical protein